MLTLRTYHESYLDFYAQINRSEEGVVNSGVTPQPVTYNQADRYELTTTFFPAVISSIFVWFLKSPILLPCPLHAISVSAPLISYIISVFIK